MRPSPTFLVAIGLALLSQGCATIFSGTSQEVQVFTEPADAQVQVSDQPQIYRNNPKLELERGHPHRITVSKEGYQTQTVQVTQNLNGHTFWNILTGPFFIVGLLVDLATGAIQDLEPEQIRVTMVPGTDPIAPLAQPPAPSGPLTPQEPPGTAGLTHTMAKGDQLEWVVAVMNATAADATKLSPETLSALTDQVRVFLGARRLKVVDRGAQEAALKSVVDAEKANSYQACFADDCQIPLGKALAASHILRTRLARFGTACTTNGELVDLAREVTSAAASIRSDCDEVALLDAAERLAESLVRGSAR